MSIKDRVLALSIAVIAAVGLAACANGGATQPEEVAVYQVEVQKPFEHRDPRSSDDLSVIAKDAATHATDLKKQMKSDAEETELAKKVNADFKKANEAYRSGDYAAAQSGYENILVTYPLHYGANVNLALALLQQERNPQALMQALTCANLFPKDGAILLNVQAAGVGCGFAMEDLEEVMHDLVAAEALDEVETGGEYEQYYAYNTIWDRIDTELESATAMPASRATSGDGAAGEAADEAAVEEASESTRRGDSKAYERLVSDLDDLVERDGDDDLMALSAYLYAVGLQLGYEADPSLVDPVHTMPYVAVDSPLCTIRVVDLAKQGSDWNIEFEVTNKTEDVHMGIGRGKTWIVNGKEVAPRIDEMHVSPGKTSDMTLRITGGDLGAAGDVTSFAGTLVVSSQMENEVIAAYPVAWEAAVAE